MSVPQPIYAYELMERAEDFYKAFKDLPRRHAPDWPRYFLFCHALELALNAFLAARGLTKGQLKELHHSLRKLLAEAQRQGLSLSPSTATELELLDEAHSEFWHRYPAFGKPVFVIDPFAVCLEELFVAVRRAV
jgi:hypothetical protein